MPAMGSPRYARVSPLGKAAEDTHWGHAARGKDHVRGAGHSRRGGGRAGSRAGRRSPAPLINAGV